MGSDGINLTRNEVERENLLSSSLSVVVLGQCFNPSVMQSLHKIHIQTGLFGGVRVNVDVHIESSSSSRSYFVFVN